METSYEIILGIQVHDDTDDILSWHYNKNGLFSVKSAYKVCVEDIKRSNERRGGSSSGLPNGHRDLLWKQLWNLNCPRKMVHTFSSNAST
jgi:hypothetical protein